jgi:transcriptional regulator with XRE-family HTH domain
MAKRAPHLRLKALRKITGDTQVKLSERCGISYPYLLAVETGQRAMSEKLAKRISYATGVSKDWLMYAPGTSETPQTFFFQEYTTDSWKNHRQWEGNRFPQEDFGDVGDELMISDDQLFRLGAVLRAAWRRGKFSVAIMMLRDFIKSMEQDLNLAETVSEELRHDAPDELLEADHENHDLPYESSIHFLLPLLSPSARYKWAKACAEGGNKMEWFISEAEDLRAMILRSFALQKDNERGEPHPSPTFGLKQT